MSRSRSRLAADWFAKLRVNSTTQAVEHEDVEVVDAATAAAIANIDMTTKADVTYVDTAINNIPPSDDASALTTGTLPDGRFPAVLPAVSGANLTGLAASFADLTDTTVSASDPTISTNPSAVGHLWLNTTSGEQFVATDITAGANVWTNTGIGSAAVAPPYNVDFLVIAGGGGGGSSNTDKGAGAGGYLNSYNSEASGANSASLPALSVNLGATYSITVGAGGSPATNGADSTISATGMTTLIAVGGGRNDANGGSGGGSGSGTANQGMDGGPYVTWSAKAGGGGAGQVGGTPTADAASPGGNGLSSSITGSAVTRAGGGGGACHPSYSCPGGASGGAGGGGAGGHYGVGGSGAANTGSGGGGGGNAQPGGSGGSGIVILRMPTVNYSGISVGNPIVTTDGTDTILQFTSSGSYTG